MRHGRPVRPLASPLVDTDRPTSDLPSAVAAGTAAHSRAVARQAELLVNRLLAIKALGTLCAELQSLDAVVRPVGGPA
jgi:hypothetical protein